MQVTLVREFVVTLVTPDLAVLLDDGSMAHSAPLYQWDTLVRTTRVECSTCVLTGLTRMSQDLCFVACVPQGRTRWRAWIVC